jgi:putative heme-binding domain-containing protein
MRRFSGFLLLAVVLSVAVSHSEESGFKPLFNGKDLKDWDGNSQFWSVVDGSIVGKTNDPKDLAYNQFLIWRGGKVKNFELKVKAKVIGNNNSGIQYRSKEFPEVGKWSIGGYQCDIHPDAPNNAMLYGERTVGIMGQNGQSIVISPQGAKYLVEQREPIKVNIAEWHEYSVIAQGNKLTHKLDGKVALELTDHNEKSRVLEGLLAFQVHRGPAMEVHIKEVLLKELPDGGTVEFDESKLPKGTKKIEAPAPKKEKADPKAKEKVDPKSKDKSAKKGTGEAIGDNRATPVDRITAAKDFKVELLYSVPSKDQGSWVNLCVDPKGRIYVSDQYGMLYRFPAPEAGKPLDPSKIEKVNVDIRAVNGMHFDFGALYVGVNDYERKIPNGLYKITDTNNDDQLDKVELLRAIEGGGDHGVHAVMTTPDKKNLYLVCGNAAKPTQLSPSSPVPQIWGEDHLLPRVPDGRGFMKDVLAPGGIIYRVTPDGKEFQAYASGFRNIFDASVNSDGELFTYDADMEWDFNTSWYRPTRINHVISGAEFGWRNGAGKRPEFYADNLPGTLNIGPGSPTGTTFGYGAKFPAKYQKALYALDWSWGKVYAVHLEADGSTYKATKEEFLTGGPLPVCDAIIHPGDGAMYFTIGGRKVQSGLYRVTYVGKESTAPIDLKPVVSPERKVRHELEAFHGKQDPSAVAKAWDYLDSKDRFLRWAARTAIEHQPAESWGEKALTESNPTKQIEALMALARVKGICPPHRKMTSPPVDGELGNRILEALLKIDSSKLPAEFQLGYLRTLEIVMNRFGRPNPKRVEALLTKLEPMFPSSSREMNWLLCETLVYLQSPTVGAKAIKLLNSAPTQEEQIEYARSLRMLKTGWTKETRTAYLEWFLKAANYRGGASFTKFIELIRTDAVASLSEEEKKEFATLLAKQPEKKSVLEQLAGTLKDRKLNTWKMEDLTPNLDTAMKGRNFENGRKMFAATGCFACHRFGNEGGMTGPDLTTARSRYSAQDLLDQIINPSKVINDQYSAVRVVTDDGKVHSGVVVNLNGDSITLNIDLTDPDLRVNIDRKKIEEMSISKVSPMPENLLAPLTKSEILDLLAYVLSSGDPNHAMFK